MITTIKRIGLRCAFYKLLSRLNPNDKEITSACDRIGAYKYLLRYRYVLDKLSSSRYHRTDQRQTKVWVCWLQGYDKAPHIVKRCIDSIRQHSRGLDIVVIDNTNIHDYMTVPHHISEKYEKGIIPNAHYSDYIRVSLLALHGGIWIDSTVLLTDSLPDRIVDTDLFCFKLQSIGKAYASNWFIASAAQHPFLVQIAGIARRVLATRRQACVVLHIPPLLGNGSRLQRFQQASVDRCTILRRYQLQNIADGTVCRLLYPPPR